MLFDELKKANIEALKTKKLSARTILSIAINKCMLLNVEKRAQNQELIDADVVSILLKTIKEVEDETNAFKEAGRQEQYLELLKQKEVLLGFLPKMLSEEEIRKEIDGLVDKSLPSIMRHFKSNFNSKCDMKLVNLIAKDYI